jgi:hypothetical protein
MKIKATTAAEVCAQFDLPRKARVLLRPGITPPEFMNALLAHKEFIAGIDFLAHALPIQEGIWWGCLCMQHACGDKLSPADKAAAIAAVRWIDQPTRENRTAAEAPADAAGPSSPAGTLARAASLAADDPRRSIANAVHLASVKGGAARMGGRQRSYFELGVAIAQGKFFEGVRS